MSEIHSTSAPAAHHLHIGWRVPAVHGPRQLARVQARLLRKRLTMAGELIVAMEDRLRAILREELQAILGARTTVHAGTDWITTTQVAAMLGCKPRYVGELARRQKLPSHQPSGRGGRRIYRRSEVEAWVAERSGSR